MTTKSDVLSLIRHKSLTQNGSLIFDQDSQSIFEWCPYTESLKPISRKKAASKYLENLTSEGFDFFEINPYKLQRRQKFVAYSMWTLAISFSIVLFFTGIGLASADEDVPWQVRVVYALAGCVPGSLTIGGLLVPGED